MTCQDREGTPSFSMQDARKPPRKRPLFSSLKIRSRTPLGCWTSGGSLSGFTASLGVLSFRCSLMNPASMFHSKAWSLQLALAQKRPWWPPLWASSPFCLSSRDDRALVPVHSAVKILSVILDLNPHLTYGDVRLLLGGTGMMSRSRDVCKADTVEPLPTKLLMVQS